MIMRKLRNILPLLALLLPGCASHGVVQNAPLGSESAPVSYSFKNWNNEARHNEIELILAFSGGGTRAAALSYGVLKALRDLEISIDGRHVSLLDEIDFISSVSGGSFTAAYYGLHGKKIFSEFEEVFLRRNIQQSLTSKLLNPINWFRSTGRTEWAIQHYDENVFNGATFADMVGKDRPLIVINASDLGYGVRFSFLQEYFNLICSDLATFPVARAVAASSAVPVLFNPVVLENHDDCGSEQPAWLEAYRERAVGNERLTNQVEALASYFDKEKRRYAHFVDGGITDNLGLRAIVDIVDAAGGARSYFDKLGQEPPRHVVTVVVDASTVSKKSMDTSTRKPTMLETVSAMSDIQLHRYNIATIELIKQANLDWARMLSTPERPITAHFVLLSFRDAKPEWRSFLNEIPTSFSLSDEQVDALISVGGELLLDNHEFRRFMVEVNR